MAQLYFSLACLLATFMFWVGDGQGVGTQLEGNRGSFVCQQRCADLDGEGVREIRDDTLFEGNYMGSCVCQQSCSGQGTITEDRMEAMLQRMVLSIEIKMTATSNKVESLQQTVDQLTQNVRSICPRDFVFNFRVNICFKLYTERLSRADASTFCQSLGPGARLVVLDTTEKAQLVAEHLSAHYGTQRTELWIGGRQEEDEGQWLWETGQEITLPWGPEQPNNYNNQDCLGLALHNGWPGWRLNDLDCSFSGHHVCEY